MPKPPTFPHRGHQQDRQAQRYPRAGETGPDRIWLVPEAWGGTTIMAEISAKQKMGLQELLELILLQAEVLELRGNPGRPMSGTVIEAKLDRGRGPVATVLVQDGTLHAENHSSAGPISDGSGR